jgi:iron only hydrogenase large subunit-like protein
LHPLRRPHAQVLLRFASAYGFRNIQTLMRKVKLGRCEYDYVEVMACPGGCLNGGGQLKPQLGQSPAQLLTQLEEVYEGRGDVVQRRPEENGEVAGLYRQWVGAGVGSQRARELLHTVYHKRDKTVSSAMSDW